MHLLHEHPADARPIAPDLEAGAGGASALVIKHGIGTYAAPCPSVSARPGALVLCARVEEVIDVLIGLEIAIPDQAEHLFSMPGRLKKLV